MKRAMSLAVIFLLGWSCARAVETHPAKGVVLKVDAAHRTLIVSCEAIPNYMDAMEMPFLVRDAAALANLKPGTAVSFTIIARGVICMRKTSACGLRPIWNPSRWKRAS